MSYIGLNVTSNSHWLLYVLDIIVHETPYRDPGFYRQTVFFYWLSSPFRVFLSKGFLTINLFLTLRIVRVYKCSYVYTNMNRIRTNKSEEMYRENWMRSARCFSILRTVRIGTTVTRFQIRLHFTLKCFTNAKFEENITEIQLLSFFSSDNISYE